MLERLVEPSIEIAIVGAADDARTKALVHSAGSAFLPNAVVALGDPKHPSKLPLLAEKTGDGPLAFVCRDFACDIPAKTPDELRQRLDAAQATASAARASGIS